MICGTNSAPTRKYRWVKRYSASGFSHKWCLEKHMGERQGLWGDTLPEWETVFSVPLNEVVEFFDSTFELGVEH